MNLFRSLDLNDSNHKRVEAILIFGWIAVCTVLFITFVMSVALPLVGVVLRGLGPLTAA